MQHIKYIILGSFLLIATQLLVAQNKLTKEAAVQLALENNYGIKVSKNNVEIAKNNSSIYNSRYLPTLAANAGANLGIDNTTTDFRDGTTSDINNANTENYNASIGVSYLLFDGFGRSYNYKKLKEVYNLSELESKSTIEYSLLQLFETYYNVARFTGYVTNQKKSLDISKQRLQRENYSFEYGQSTKLDVLNAEVDVNNDSINYLNLKRNLDNTKHNLNVILGRPISTLFEVETTVSYALKSDLEELISKAKQHNINIQKLDKNLAINDFNIKINKAGYLPKLNLNTSYSWLKNNADVNFNYYDRINDGLAAGVSLNWNIFDGGATKTKVEAAKIEQDNLLIRKEEALQETELNVTNAWHVYQNALYVLQAEEKNVETNKRNFERTQEQFKLGQITSIQFRQAQLNLFNSENNYNESKYDAKIAELNLLQLTGELLKSEF